MMENDRQKPVTGYPAAQSSYPTQSGYPSGGVAYPYPAPPPAPNYYQSYPPPPPPHDRVRFNSLRRIIIVVISIFLIIGAISFIFWLVLRPRAPVVRLDSGSAYPFNISSTHLTATFNFSFTLLNPNKKMGVYYDEIVVSVGYKYFLKIDNSEAPLYQKKGESTVVRSLIVASSENVEEYTAKKLSADRATGTVDFNVRIHSWIRYKSGVWRSRRHLMRAFCDDVKLGFSNSTGVGTLLGSSRNCEVDL